MKQKVRNSIKKSVVIFLILSCIILIFEGTGGLNTKTQASAVNKIAIESIPKKKDIYNILANHNSTDSESKTIKVGWYDLNGYQETDSEGKRSGYYYDLLQIISYYNGWKYEYVDGSWEDCLSAMKNGDIDLLCNVHYIQERQQWINYSARQVHSEIYCLYVPKDNSNIEYEKFDKFDGMRIASVSNSYDQTALQQYATDNHFTYKEIKKDTFAEACDAVRTGEADALISSCYENYEDYKIIGKFSPMPVFITTSKKSGNLIGELDEAIDKISSFYPYVEMELYENNLKNLFQQNLTFTQKEQDYLNAIDSITMACGSDGYPFEYYDEEKQCYAGISVDLLKMIAEKLGKKINFITDNGYTASNFTDNFKQDAITTMTSDTRWADDCNMYQTQPIMYGNVMMICNDKSNVKSVATLDGGYIYGKVLKFYPELEVKTYDTISECLDAIRYGKADCTFLNEYEASYYLAKSKYRKLTQTRISEFKQDLCFGISNKSNKTLNDILCKELKSLNQDQINDIIYQNTLPPKESWVDLFRYEHPGFIIFVNMSFFIMFILILFLSYRNHTEQKQRIAYKKMNDAKTEFLSRISHDMRTPMNGILGLTLISQDEQDPAVLHQTLDKIKDSGDYLLSLINDTLDFNKIESDKITLNVENVNLEELLENIIDMAQPSMQAKNIDFTYQFNHLAKNDSVILDRVRTKQIFMNLLSNAMKFTPIDGKVKLTADCIRKDRKKICCRFTISDTGIGMSKDFLENQIFSPFSQEFNKVSAEYTGSGLGLAIVKKLVVLQNGTISVHSEQGKGTMFSLYFEFKRSTESDAKVEKKENESIYELKDKRILLVEDNELNSEIVESFLMRQGMLVDRAMDGKQAVEQFDESQLHYYDAILMDVRMPVMDGLEATARIRALNREDAGNVPIIALTANAFREDQDETAEAGMNAHLSKPINPKSLYQTLNIQINH